MPKKRLNEGIVTYKILTREFLPQLMSLQEETFKSLPDIRMLRKNSEANFDLCFIPPSVVLGVLFEGQLIGYGILFYAGESKENLAYDIQNTNVLEGANVKLILVKPEYRGNGLQLQIISKLESIAKSNNTKFLCATVSPLNTYSLNNFYFAGYKGIKTLIKYGGLERILLIKYLS